ncbi:EpsG family protein [Leptospira jelokensis]|uniref:EpsG family protein n=1 Tax=Leptospira jelokensis TaxID=2484931 RepID=UPI0010913F07|nr:EpsG family protein [Leptospira jelokensis]TGL99232.1 hypothetical protein EHQ79_15585 [Leptospira jelokensis]
MNQILYLNVRIIHKRYRDLLCAFFRLNRKIEAGFKLNDIAKYRKTIEIPFFTLGLLFTFYAPTISIIFLTLYLIFSDFEKNNSKKIILYILLAFNFSVIHSSRSALISPNDDLNFYYSSIYKSDFSEQLNIWKLSPMEPLIFLLILLVKIVLGNLSPAGLMFVFTFASSLILIYGIILFSKGIINRKLEPVFVSASIISFGYFYSTQLVRQQFSMLFAVVAFGFIRNQMGKGKLYWVISLLFHFGSIFYLTIFILSRRVLKFKYFVFNLFVGCLIFIFLFILLINTELYKYLDFIPVLKYKFEFYHERYQIDNLVKSGFGIVSAHDTIFLFSYLFLLLFSFVLNNNKINKLENKLLFGVFILYFMFLPFTLFGFRLSLLVTSVLFGFYKVWVFHKISILTKLYVLLKVASLSYFFNFGYMKLEKSGMELYGQFPPCSTEFFFYLKYFTLN